MFRCDEHSDIVITMGCCSNVISKKAKEKRKLVVLDNISGQLTMIKTFDILKSRALSSV